jgi:hypothetical protein
VVDSPEALVEAAGHEAAVPGASDELAAIDDPLTPGEDRTRIPS